MLVPGPDACAGGGQAPRSEDIIMPSIFVRMLAGELPGRFIWKDERTAAILSDTPIKPGHCIVFSRQEITSWLDFSPDLQAELFETCRHVGRAIQQVCQPVRVGLGIVSIINPHVHIHLVPIAKPTDMDFGKQDQNAAADALDAMAAQIRAALGPR